jgi:hypothetical protein
MCCLETQLPPMLWFVGRNVTRQFVSLSTIQKIQRFQISNLHLKGLAEQEQSKVKISSRKEITKVRVEIN